MKATAEQGEKVRIALADRASASSERRKSKKNSAGVATGVSAQGRHARHRHSGIGGHGCTKGCAPGAIEGQVRVMLLGAATQSGQRGQAGQGGADAIQLQAIDANTTGVHKGKTMLEQDGYGVYILWHIKDSDRFGRFSNS